MKKIKIAFCPTMAIHASKIKEDLSAVEIIVADRAAQALTMLRSGSADAVLIGRTARKKELSPGTKGKRFMGGITLIYKMKTGISVDQLSQIPVVTYLKEEQLGELKNAFAKVYFAPTLEDCVKDGLETPVLIDWNDFRDEFEFLIPLTSTGKDLRFRAPVFYYKNLDEETLSEIEKSLKECFA